MATMVKEKRKDKKKTRQKQNINIPIPEELEDDGMQERTKEKQNTKEEHKSSENIASQIPDSISTEKAASQISDSITTDKAASQISDSITTDKAASQISDSITTDKAASQNFDGIPTDKAASHNFDSITTVNVHSENKFNAQKENVIKVQDVYEQMNQTVPINDTNVGIDEFPCQSSDVTQNEPTPSAPVFEEEEIANPPAYNIECISEDIKPKIQCMPLEEAVRLFGGVEISEVRAISEKEEAIVEAGPISGPEHPLVDLLSSFRSSLNAMDHEGTTISQGFIQEEKSRSLLWKIKKETGFSYEYCPSCAKSLSVTVSFETAALQTEKIPAARMRLEALAREVQESYCHHQHTALMAYYQIEELVYMTIQSGANEIREALSLVLQALRLSDVASAIYSASLQRWAVALAAKLLYTRDLRHLIFLIHHLFRQSRSVRWASRVLRVQVTDVCGAARAIALLELMLARPGLETAVECTEELVEGWEEVGKSGEGSAVGDGLLRERDALALLRALPLRDLLAKMALFNRSEIESTKEQEWGDGSGGHGVLKAACGARAVLSVLQRAMHVHAHYARLQRELTELCACALQLIAALHLRSRHAYHPEVADRVQAELEAVFVAGLLLHQGQELTRLPATLLSEATARDYCFGLIATLHDKGPHRISSLDVEVGVVRCDVRVRIVLQAALDRTDDHELARILLQFLCQTAVKRKPQWCRQPCEVAAREALPRLLAAHPYLHAISLHVLADLNHGEPVEPSAVNYLSVQEWRPNYDEVLGVLEDWSLKCPHLIEHLLLQMEYTPHQGVSLETQLAMGAWLCEYVRRVGGEAREWGWSVLERLRVHRAQWAGPLEAPPPAPEPQDVFSSAFALLATSWGHSVPLICSVGVRALVGVSRARPGAAASCLVAMMRSVQHTPESVALTSEFTEVFSILLGSGPSLMARALGRAGPASAELLEKALLNELLISQPHNAGILNPWVRGLWALNLPSAARALLDTALRAVDDVTAVDTVVSLMLQGENSKEFLDDAVRNSAVAPLLCEAALRGAHAQCELSAHMWPRLTDAVVQQRACGHKVHVDNALKKIGCTISSEELVIYRTASALLSAPPTHPAHLTLWRLFFHLYLQRPPSSPQMTSIPVGPLFFSGIIKSRVLSQLKKRIQEAIGYHKTQSEKLKNQVYPQIEQVPTTSDSRKTTNTKTSDRKLFAPIAITDLIEDCISDSDTDSSEEEITEERVSESSATRENFHLYCYHSGALKMLSEYSVWLSEGDKTRAAPHHADIARFIQHEGISAARRNSLPGWYVSATPRRARAPPPAQRTPLQQAIHGLLQIKNARSISRLPNIKPLLDEQNNLSDARVIFNLVDRYLKTMEADAQMWCREVSQLSQLDSKLLELVRALRVRRPLPLYTRWCGNDTCKPIQIAIQRHEWVISTVAEEGIEQNRRCALGALRALARPRPGTARVAATLQALVRVVRSRETAVRVAERAGGSVTAVHSFPPAMDAITSLVTHLAECWVCGDASACGRLLRAWAGGVARTLCSALVQPRRLQCDAFLQLYETVLTAPLPPPAAFSYLSRFEMGAWAEKVDPAEREKMLDVLVQAAQRWGPAPEPEHHVLLELIGVHIGSVCGVGEVCALLVRGARACGRGSLPPALCAHLTHAAAHAHALTYNQLGNLLRELGAIWWETRTSLKEETNKYVPYASHVADLLQVLQQAFTAATKALGHDTERVSWFAWSVLREAWSPWVQPGTPPPLLPLTHADTHAHAHADMLQRFRQTLELLMEDCPGSDVYVLRHVWEWAVHTYVGAGPAAPQPSRVALSALLAALDPLPWHTAQWMHAACMPLALQICRSSEREVVSWCSARWRCACAASWLRGVHDAQLAPHLAALLTLFCSPQLQLDTQVLEEAALLPWQRLPESALDAAFEQFFVDFHNPAFPYHETMQFRLLLCASQLLIVGESAECSAGARARRTRSVSQCVRAAATPTLTQHARAHTETMLRVLTDLAPHIEQSEGEIEELLSRALVIMCMEHAAAAALPVWQQWVQDCGVRLRLAAASAAASLTALDYFVPLVDTIARTHMTSGAEGGWCALRVRLSTCAWGGGAADAAGARRGWHAAYALLPKDTPPSLDVLRALAAFNLTPSDDDPITAVWVCVLCRVALRSRGVSDVSDTSDTSAMTAVSEVTAVSEMSEVSECARGVLARWAAEPRRSLLQLVAMQHDTHTLRIRVLCRLALCILDPSSAELAKSYEASCSALPPGQQASWGRAPGAKHLPRLAALLYPGKDAYFTDEVELLKEIT